MQIFTAVVLGALSGITLAMPAGSSVNNTLIARDRPGGTGPGDRCGDSMFFDRTSGGSPLIADCMKLANAIRTQPDKYKTLFLPNTDEDPVRLFEAWEVDGTGNCIFGVRKAYHGPQETRVVVGYTDAADLITDSVNKYGRDGKVGSEGAMICQYDPVFDGTREEGVWWGVFKAP